MTPIPLPMRKSHIWRPPCRACRVPFFAWVHHVEEVGKVTPNNDLGEEEEEDAGAISFILLRHLLRT